MGAWWSRNGVATSGPASPAHLCTFRVALRRAIQVRDQRCTHPSGCDEPAERCDVDHTVPVNAGGITDQFGGRIGGGAHHRAVKLRRHGNFTPLPRRRTEPIVELRLRIRWRLRHLGADP